MKMSPSTKGVKKQRTEMKGLLGKNLGSKRYDRNVGIMMRYRERRRTCVVVEAVRFEGK